MMSEEVINAGRVIECSNCGKLAKLCEITDDEIVYHCEYCQEYTTFQRVLESQQNQAKYNLISDIRNYFQDYCDLYGLDHGEKLIVCHFVQELTKKFGKDY